MEKVLNITNGDCTVAVMEKAGIPGTHLPWRDVLHDGPVPAGLSLEALSNIRATFISDAGWGTYETIRKSFSDRDQLLMSSGDFKTIRLWFEHDLYDQLQLIQILDWYARHEEMNPGLKLICTENYLGSLTPDALLDLQRFEVDVSKRQLDLASRAWEAVRSETPDALLAMINEDTGELPFLKQALQRFFEEYPDCDSGLSRTEMQALKIIAQGERKPYKIFARNQEMESRVYLGDGSFWNVLEAFLQADPALIENISNVPGTRVTPDMEIEITEAGRQVLSGEKNWLNSRTLDKWMGGVRLSNQNMWCRRGNRLHR